MRKIFLFCLLLVSGCSFAGTKDTMITGDLNHDNILDRVTVSFTTNDGLYSYLAGDFSVNINGSVYKDKCNEAEVFEVKIVSIEPDDLLPAVMVSCFAVGDIGEYFFYSYKNKNIVPLGSIKLWGGVEVPGNGKILINDFMGFWTLHGEYIVQNDKLVKVKKDTYDVNVEGTVTNPFKILKSRDDNSEVVENVKPKTTVMLLKCDVSPVCKNEAGYDDEYECDWYLIKTASGKEGWVRLKDFREQITDLPWAG